MAVIRINKTKDYTVMANHHLKNKKLSLKAKGLMSIMLSLPDDWDYSIEGLMSICCEKENAITSALNELKKYGYLRVDKIMPNESHTGRIEYIYNIFEIPKEKQGVENQGVENQGLVFQGVEIQGLENQGQLNTNISNTNILNTNNKKERRSSHYDEILDSFSLNEEVRFALTEFVKMRLMNKKPLTDCALKLIVEKVNQLSNGDPKHAVAIMNQSIMNNWQDIYELKDGYIVEPKKTQKKKGSPSEYEVAKIKETLLKDEQFNTLISEKKKAEYTMADYLFKNAPVPENLQSTVERLSKSANARICELGYSPSKLKNIGLVF